MRIQALALVALLLLAGCSGKPSTEKADPSLKATDRPLLQGYVFDQALHPVVGANLTVQGAGVDPRGNGTAATGQDGHYAFRDLPVEQRLVVVVQAAGLKTLSKQVSLGRGNSTLLNFTLEAVVVAKPYHEAQGFNGFLACETATTANDQTEATDCGGTQNLRVWTLNVNADVQGIVIETGWIPKTPAAKFLHATVETVGLGDQDAILSEVEGGSVLKAVVTQAQCQKYYPQGGTLRVTWSAATNAADQESAAGAAAAVQQDFKAIATAFYVEPPDPSFTGSA
jgi:hypothetical protein